MSRAEKSCLLELSDELLPEPQRERAGHRIASTVVVASFFLVFLWLTLAYTTDTGVYTPLTWQLRPSVSWQTVDQAKEVDADYGEGWTLAEDNKDLGADEGQEEDGEEEEEDEFQTKQFNQVDYWQYRWHRTLKWRDDGGRLIAIGDVHGMVNDLRKLLADLDYKPESDTLVFVGDLVAKHPSLQSSLDTLDYIRGLNARAVRGNHDDYVLGWAHWMRDARKSQFPTTTDTELKGFDFATWQDLSFPKKPETLPRYPSSWKWHSEHFFIAQRMSQASFEWFADVPLTIHIPSINAFVVHAGMLPTSVSAVAYNAPTENPADEEDDSFDGNASNTAEDDFDPPDLDSQLDSVDPLYFTPSRKVRNELKASSAKNVLLVKQNREPRTLFEVRGVTKGGKPHKNGNRGVSWHRIWNHAMKKCRSASLDATEDDSEEEDFDDPATDLDNDEDSSDLDESRHDDCQKINIIYGHWAAENLHIGHHTFGLDSGAVYGRELSALVIGGKVHIPHAKSLEITSIKLDGRRGFIASLPCKEPK